MAQEVPNPDMMIGHETVRINMVVLDRNGGLDFLICCPMIFGELDYNVHYNYWKNKVVPSSWRKFRDVSLVLVEKGVVCCQYRHGRNVL